MDGFYVYAELVYMQLIGSLGMFYLVVQNLDVIMRFWLMIQVYKQDSYFGNVEITEDILSKFQ